jgi:hypothetical protein
MHGRIVEDLGCQIPARDYDALAEDLVASVKRTQGGNYPPTTEPENDEAIRSRIDDALSHPRFKWRSLDKVAAVAAVTVERATEILLADDRVRFSRGKSGEVIVGLRSRVGDR